MTNQTTVARTPGEAVAGGPNYRYERFTTRLMLADLRFSRRAPQPVNFSHLSTSPHRAKGASAPPTSSAYGLLFSFWDR